MENKNANSNQENGLLHKNNPEFKNLLKITDWNTYVVTGHNMYKAEARQRTRCAFERT